MAGRRRGMISTATTAAVAVALGGGWLADLLVPASYPGEAAYKVPGLTDPPVDRAALQRSWPAGLEAPDGRVRLINYMAKVDHGRIPPPASSVAEAAAKPAPQADLGTLLASADVERGRGAARVCGSCHTVEAGGANRTGPNLWGVVGRPIASHGGFAYSPAMVAQAGNWSYERLDQYLASPAKAVPGTKMAFGGVRNPKDRANLLAYLGSLSSSPAPFPAAKAATPTETAALPGR